MTYKQIYATVNRVKPCRFKTENGMVMFELIENEGEQLCAQMVSVIRALTSDFFYGVTQYYTFPSGTQRRTWFRITKN